MNYIWTIIKGMFLGIANVIPGVSGGTMAVSFGIYDDLIHAITHLRKEWKSSLKVLVPIGLSAVFGIIAFSFLIEWLLDHYTLYTAFAFVGLILGGLPLLISSFRDSLKAEQKKVNVLHLFLFIAFFIIVAWMGIAEVSGSGNQSVELSFGLVVALFFVGLVSAAAMVIPGISGSLLMLILGFYYTVINTINQFTAALTSLDFNALVPATLLLAGFGIGMIVGVIIISKIIDYLFKNQPGYTYAAILGLVFASPVAVVANTQALADLNQGNTVLILLIALVLLAVCFYFAYAIGLKEDTTAEIPEESKHSL